MSKEKFRGSITHEGRIIGDWSDYKNGRPLSVPDKKKKISINSMNHRRQDRLDPKTTKPELL